MITFQWSEPVESRIGIKSEPDDIVGVDPALGAVVASPYICAAGDVGSRDKVFTVIDRAQLIVIIVAGVAAQCQITGLYAAADRSPVCGAAGMH